MVGILGEKATRLPLRQESFTDLNDPGRDQEGLSSSDFLVQENERLRQQVEDLQAQVHQIRSFYQHQQKKAAPGVVLELPRTLKPSRLAALNCLRSTDSNLSKDHQSLATDDDQSTVEPSLDLDVYESARGLKKRQALPSTKRKSIIDSPANITRKTEPLSSNDVSLTSEEEEDDRVPAILLEEADDSDDNNDDDDGPDIDIESRQLLRPSTTVAPSRHRTRPVVVEEESFWSSVSDRAGWLVGLLILQSMSSFILARNEALLQKHLVIVRFLTMLVGAGGNAGNQASVRVIRGLAVGTIDPRNPQRVLKREFAMGAALSLILGTAGCIRAAVFSTPWLETVAITVSLLMIVSISIILGAIMPLGMKLIGIDPAHSSTTIQVVMDILGVSITVWMSSLVLDTGFHYILFSSFLDAR